MKPDIKNAFENFNKYDHNVRCVIKYFEQRLSILRSSLETPSHDQNQTNLIRGEIRNIRNFFKDIGYGGEDAQ